MLKIKEPTRLSVNMISRLGFDQKARGKRKGPDKSSEAIKRRFRPILFIRCPPAMLPKAEMVVAPSRSRAHWLRFREFK